MPPKVKVIAYTKFIGVPIDLWLESDASETFSAAHSKGQDSGTDAGRLIECAGRVCYDSYGKGRSSKEFHGHILDVMHGSVTEHPSLTFFASGISRGLSHELVRHRAGTGVSQRSTRFVDESESDWCWHPLIEKFCSEEVRIELENVRALAQRTYRYVVEEIQIGLTALGVDKTSARKQARGAARGVLGNALETMMVWTANIRALRNVLEQRASAGADAEIRLLANALYEAAMSYCPEYLSDYQKVECPDGIGYGLVTEHRKI